MTGRYVVVWFTRLPWIDGNYRGGVRSIVVRSGLRHVVPSDGRRTDAALLAAHVAGDPCFR